MNEKDRLICEIFQLAYLVNQYTPFCTFVRFSGHVNKAEIEIRQSKENWQSELLESEFYVEYKKYYDDKDPLAFYKAKRDILVRILKEEEIPYEDCDVEKYLVEDYTF